MACTLLREQTSHFFVSFNVRFQKCQELSFKFFSSLFCAVTNGSSHSPTALNGAPSPPNGYSNGPSSSSSSSLANQQLPPACGARQLSKLKRFLTTLQQFGNDISPEIGERVRTLVLGLVVSVYENGERVK